MPIALNPKVTWEYVLERERKLDKAKQTIFNLKALSGIQRQAAKDQFGRGQKETFLLIYGLTSWTLKDATGNAVPFKRNDDGDCHLDNLDYLSDDDITELALAILKRNRLTKEEEKN